MNGTNDGPRIRMYVRTVTILYKFFCQYNTYLIYYCECLYCTTHVGLNVTAYSNLLNWSNKVICDQWQCQYHYGDVITSNNAYALWCLMWYDCLNNGGADAYKLSVPAKSCARLSQWTNSLVTLSDQPCGLEVGPPIHNPWRLRSGFFAGSVNLLLQQMHTTRTVPYTVNH